MKTLHRYLLRQVLASLVMTVLVFTFVLLLGNALRDILPLLIHREATFGMLAKAIGLLIPFVGVFALPISLLTATLLVFGRFSADQELTAARASGVSLLSLVLPVLLLSLALSAVSAAVNLDIAPRCRVAYINLRQGLKTAVLSRLRLPEGLPISTFPGYVIYIGKVRQTNLQDILLLQVKDDTNIVTSVRAPRGSIELDRARHQLLLRLYNATTEDVASGFTMVAGEATRQLELRRFKKGSDKPDISDMTYLQLRRELRQWDRRINQPAPRLSAAQRRHFERQRRKWNDLAEPIRVQIHRDVAFSFACFSFALIGIPLGIRVHRRETNVGIAIALGLVAVYYALIIVANSQSTHAEWKPHLWMWAPNLLFQSIGVILLWRVNRGI